MLEPIIKTIVTLRRLVSTTTVEEEVQQGTEEVRGDGGESNEGPMSEKRSKYWFEHIEKTVENNAERSRKNKMILNRIDLRSTWIMRILLAIIGTVAVAYISSLGFF